MPNGSHFTKDVFADGIIGLVCSRQLDGRTKDRPSFWNERLGCYTISLFLIHPWVRVPPTGGKVCAWSCEKKIQKEVQTLMMLPGVKHARNNSRMAGNHVSSWMIKTEGAIMGSGRLTGGEEWERFPEEADAELGTEGCVLVKRSTEAGSRWWRRRVPSSLAPTDTPKLQLPMGRLYEWPED